MKNDEQAHLVTMILDRPIPVQGLHDQHLGMITRCRFSLREVSVHTLELQTLWQTIELKRSSVSYDEDAGVFRLLRQSDGADQ